MNDTKISKILAAEILSGANHYLMNGYLRFDKIRFTPGGHDVFVEFYNSGELLGCKKIFSEAYWPTGQAFTFELNDGSMGMYFDQSDICVPTEVSTSFDEWNW